VSENNEKYQKENNPNVIQTSFEDGITVHNSKQSTNYHVDVDNSLYGNVIQISNSMITVHFDPSLIHWTGSRRSATLTLTQREQRNKLKK
jgi:hypothetical protein